MFDGFAPAYTLEQWVHYSPHPTGGRSSGIDTVTYMFKEGTYSFGARLHQLFKCCEQLSDLLPFALLWV